MINTIQNVNKKTRQGTAQSKIMFFSTLAVVLSALLLFYLCLSQIPNQKYILEKTLRDKWRQRLQEKIDEVEKRIYDQAESTFSLLIPFDLSSYDRAFFSSSSIAGEFFLLDRNYKIVLPFVFPASVRLETEESIESIEDNDKIKKLLEQGAVFEFSSPPDLDQASDIYRKACDISYEEKQISIQSFMALGGVLYKMKRYNEAVSIYSKINSIQFKKRVLSRILLVAWLREAFCYAMANDKRGSVHCFLSIYEYILQKKFWFTDEPQLAFAEETVVEELKKLAKTMTRDEWLSFERSDRLSKRKKFCQRLCSVLQGKFLGRLSTISHRSDRMNVYLEWVNGEPSLVFYRFIYDRDGIFGGVTGFSVDIENLKERLGYISCEDKDYFFALLIGKDSIIWGKGCTGNSQALSLPSRSITDCSFLLFQQDPGRLASLIRRENIITIAMLGLSSLALFSGIYIAFRNLRRETELSMLRSQFVSSVSHELRTPLTLIRSYAETLLLGRAQESKAREYYEVILQESERLTRMIQNILGISRIESGRMCYNPCPVKIHELLQEIIDSQKSLPYLRDFRVSLEIAKDIPEIFLDTDAFTCAILNLLDNAVKYSENEKYIVIRVKRDDTKVMIEVEDKGIGIEKNEKEKIFEPFYRIYKDVKHKQGVGLGLTLVKKIVNDHGGWIEVKSEKGKGSCFSIVFKI